MKLKIFVSYARRDDDPWEGKPGFVTKLVDSLKRELQDAGHELSTDLWRDTENVDAADQFSEKIARSLQAADLLIVVYSRPWIQSEHCQTELREFARKWENDDAARRNIVVVSKRYIPLAERHSLLQGQTGYNFFKLERGAEEGEEGALYFWRGVASDEFYGEVSKLSRFVVERIRGNGAMAQILSLQVPAGLPRNSGNRVVYLAKPASDMDEYYLRVARELLARGFKIVPDISYDLMGDAAKHRVIEQALSLAELSIHLLGDKERYGADDGVSIVRLQLERAAFCAESPISGTAPSFHRVVWAPKYLGPGNENRDFQAVIEKFHRQLPGDKVMADVISKFVDFIVLHLDQIKPKTEFRAAIGGIDAGSEVFIWHKKEDADYAYELAKALGERQLIVQLPSFDDTDEENQKVTRRAEAECDAIIVTWANASSAWLKNTVPKYRDWASLGRNRQFKNRILVCGPPPGIEKRRLQEVNSLRREIDMIIDLSDEPEAIRQQLDRLMQAASGAANDEPR